MAVVTGYEALAEVYEWLISEAKLTPAEFAAAFDDVIRLLPSDAQVLDCSCVAAPQRRLGAVVDLPIPAVVGSSNLDAGVGRGVLAVAEVRSGSDLVGYLEGHGVPAFGEFSAAAEAAARASTTREFGAACGRLLSDKRLSQGEVARRAGHRLPKSTVNRIVTGASLCQTPDQVLALLEACNASDEAEVWLQSWERARVNKRRKPPAADIPSPHRDLCVSGTWRTHRPWRDVAHRRLGCRSLRL